MYIADVHCDALWKLAQKKHPVVNINSLQQGKINEQTFALFTIPNGKKEQEKRQIAAQIHAFHTLVNDSAILRHEPFAPLSSQSSKTHAILSLEGMSMFEFDSLDMLLHAGVEMVSLTWNERNQFASGTDYNKGGITSAGKKMIRWLNDHGFSLDGAHLNEESFWDAIHLADHFLVSHANIKGIYSHPRNLSDAQLLALVEKNSFVGLTCYPRFLNGTKDAFYSDIARQIEYAGELGVISILGFGTDWDGIDETVHSFASPRDFPRILDWLLLRFDEEIVKGVAGENFRRFWNNKYKQRSFQNSGNPLQ